MTLADILQKEAKAGFTSFSGTGIVGTVAVSDGILNQALADVQPGLRVHVKASNQLVFEYGPFDATVILADAIHLATLSPTLTMKVTSRLKAWLLGKRSWPPFVQFQGTLITVEIGAIPAIAEYRDIWVHVRQANVATTVGKLSITFHFAIS